MRPLILISLLAVAGPALADTAQDGQERRVERVIINGEEVDGEANPLDANGDGRITRDEFLAMHQRRWDQLDSDHDGAVDAGALRGHRMRVPGPMAPRAPMMFRHRMPEGAPGEHNVIVMRQGDGDPVVIDGDGPGRHDLRIIRRGREDMDANNDGRISLEEFTAPMLEHFQAMDSDGDGFLEEGEHMAPPAPPPPPATPAPPRPPRG